MQKPKSCPSLGAGNSGAVSWRLVFHLLSPTLKGRDLEEGSIGLGNAWNLKDHRFSLPEAVWEGGEGRLEMLTYRVVSF